MLMGQVKTECSKADPKMNYCIFVIKIDLLVFVITMNLVLCNPVLTQIYVAIWHH